MINDLTIAEIEELQRALDHLFDQRVFPLTISSPKIQKILEKDQWVNSSDLLGDLKKITDSKSLAEIQKNLSARKSELEAKPVESTVPPKEQLEKLEEEAEKQKQQRAQATAKGQKDVEQFAKQQMVIAEEAKKARETLKDKKIYVKVAEPEPIKLTGDEQKAYSTLQSMAQKTPHVLVKNITETIEKNLPETARGGTAPEEIHYYAEAVAVRAVDNLRAGPKPVDKDSIVLASLSNHPGVLDKANVSEPDKKFVVKAASDLATLKMLPYRANQEVLASVFGKNVTEQILGSDPTTFNVTFTNQPEESTDTVPLDRLAENYQTVSESPFFSEVQSFGVDKIKGKLIDFGKEKILGQISKLPADSFLGKITASEKFSSIINLLRPAQTIEATNLFGKLVMNFSPEFAPVISGIGKLTGQVAKKGLGGLNIALGNAVAKGASAIAAKLGATALSAKLGAMIGTGIIPVIGTIVGAIVGALFGKLIEKIGPWLKKHQEDLKIVGLIVLGGGMVMQSLPLMVLGGLVFVPLAIRNGLGVAGLGTKTFLFFGRLGKSMAITIGTPIIVAIVVFPILVAIILFIINSGAYIVPPQPTLESPFGPSIKCSDTKDPVSFPNTISFPIAKRAWQITADLYQGFWCFWNRSPGDFPNDITSYPPSYPELFNEAFFASSPSPTRDQAQSCGECMFWCTWLVQKAFREGGNSSLENTLWAPTMQDDFTKRGKFVSAQEAAYKAVPLDFIHKTVISGSVIFFNVSGGPYRTNHVGIVYSISKQGVQYVQSNAPLKDGFIPFGDNGYGLQSPPGLEVVGIGLP